MSQTPGVPQAYTKETVVEAFNWLQKQPESIRTQARNTDSMVGLFLRAKRQAAEGLATAPAPHSATTFQTQPRPAAPPDAAVDDSMENAPVSARHFRTDLRDLAENLKSFDDGAANPLATPTLGARAAATPPPQATGPTVPPLSHWRTPLRNESAPSSPSQQTFAQNAQQPLNPQQQQLPQEPAQRRSSGMIASFNETQGPAQGLDEKSLRHVRDTMDRLNLSQEPEALRLLVSLGYQEVLRLFDRK